MKNETHFQNFNLLLRGIILVNNKMYAKDICVQRNKIKVEYSWILWSVHFFIIFTINWYVFLFSCYFLFTVRIGLFKICYRGKNKHMNTVCTSHNKMYFILKTILWIFHILSGYSMFLFNIFVDFIFINIIFPFLKLGIHEFFKKQCWDGISVKLWYRTIFCVT